MVQVVIVLAVVVLAIALWVALELLEQQPHTSRRPGYMDRSPNGSEKPRWRVRPR